MVSHALSICSVRLDINLSCILSLVWVQVPSRARRVRHAEEVASRPRRGQHSSVRLAIPWLWRTRCQRQQPNTRRQGKIPHNTNMETSWWSR